MALTLDELNRLTANDVGFHSVYGSVVSYGINHPAEHMTAVKRHVYLNADYPGETVSFINESSTFRMLQTIGSNSFRERKYIKCFSLGRGGIIVDKKLNSTEGDIRLEFTGGSLNVTAHSHISANLGNVEFTSAYEVTIV